MIMIIQPTIPERLSSKENPKWDAKFFPGKGN